MGRPSPAEKAAAPLIGAPPQAYIGVGSDATFLPKLLFSVDEAAHVLALSGSTVRCLIDSGRLGHVREGTRKLVTFRQLLAYVDQKHLEAGWR